MTQIIYKHGDLMQNTEGLVVQGCNAQGKMRSGVAKLLRENDENVYTEYRKVYEEQGNMLRLGQTIWVASKGFVVINAITQEHYGREPNTLYASYDGIREAFRNINSAMMTMQVGDLPEIAMPLIGAGLAQGKWSIISSIIEAESTHFQPVVYLQDGVIPDGVTGIVLPQILR